MVLSSELAGVKPEPSNLTYILIFLLPMWQEGACVSKNIQIDWQWPLSGVHSIMLVNSALAGEGGGVDDLPLLSTITSKVVVYAQAERADTLLLFILHPLLLCGADQDVFTQTLIRNGHTTVELCHFGVKKVFMSFKHCIICTVIERCCNSICSSRGFPCTTPASN
jgi:hypothetical protein